MYKNGVRLRYARPSRRAAYAKAVMQNMQNKSNQALWQKVLWYLKENPEATAKAIAKVFGVRISVVKRELRELGVEI
jgi:DNA-binding MarR family transcriptional regulator